jgi:hypothetical protein
MKKILILILINAAYYGCSSLEETNISNDLQIRISNVSEFNYENININASGEMVEFGNLNSNSNSEYKIFDLAYRYAFVQFEIDGETFTLQPIDYVGETPLENGKYSYRINVNPNSQFERVILELTVE